MKQCGKCNHDEDCFDRIREEANEIWNVGKDNMDYDIFTAITKLDERLSKLEKKRI